MMNTHTGNTPNSITKTIIISERMRPSFRFRQQMFAPSYAIIDLWFICLIHAFKSNHFKWNALLISIRRWKWKKATANTHTKPYLAIKLISIQSFWMRFCFSSKMFRCSGLKVQIKRYEWFQDHCYWIIHTQRKEKRTNKISVNESLSIFWKAREKKSCAMDKKWQ